MRIDNIVKKYLSTKKDAYECRVAHVMYVVACAALAVRRISRGDENWNSDFCLLIDAVRQGKPQRSNEVQAALEIARGMLLANQEFVPLPEMNESFITQMKMDLMQGADSLAEIIIHERPDLRHHFKTANAVS